MTDKSCSGSELIKEIRSGIPETIDFSDIHSIKTLFFKLLNLLEQSANTLIRQEEVIKSQQDEINRLKGEKIRPRFKPNAPNRENDPPKQPGKKQWDKTSKNDKVKIDRTETIKVNRDNLPPDAVHAGYDDVIIQNIILSTDNILFRLEKFWSPKEGKLYKAELPKELQNTAFGPELKALIHFLKSRRMTENKIHDFLGDIGIMISEGQISNILIKEHADIFIQERQEVFEAGMKHADYFNTDDTGARHMGQNWFTHVFCSLWFTCFFTRKNKDRSTIEGLLNLSGNGWRKKIMVSDDARQFWELARIQALCWVHEIRHYRKLTPFLPPHRATLRKFMDKLWGYYFCLDEYRKNPRDKGRLIRQFDALFLQKTGYAELDDRIASTLGNKERLLVVLDYPHIPLHNNAAEIAV
ncbi:MAG: IS66 family transposase, partial [Nitrospirota bacterium]